MQAEIEVKFLGVDHDELRQQLTAIGAHCEQPMRLMRRKNYDFPDWRLKQKNGWARLRDEGNKVTLSYKQLNARTVDGMLELTVTVDNFENTDQLLASLGMITKNYQETRRETWRYGDCEIVLDDWPWVRNSVEIEGPDKKSLRAVAKKLGLNWDEGVYGSAEIVYQAEYEVESDDFNETAIMTFETPVPKHWPRKSQAKKKLA